MPALEIIEHIKKMRKATLELRKGLDDRWRAGWNSPEFNRLGPGVHSRAAYRIVSSRACGITRAIFPC